MIYMASEYLPAIPHCKKYINPTPGQCELLSYSPNLQLRHTPKYACTRLCEPFFLLAFLNHTSELTMADTDSTQKVQHVNPASLLKLSSCVAFIKSFISFTEADGHSLESSIPLIAPLIPAILDAVYSKLLSYDITAKALVLRQPGHTGNIPK